MSLLLAIRPLPAEHNNMEDVDGGKAATMCDPEQRLGVTQNTQVAHCLHLALQQLETYTLCAYIWNVSFPQLWKKAPFETDTCKGCTCTVCYSFPF